MLVVEATADKALARVERVSGVGHRLALGGLTHEALALSVKATMEGVVRAPSAFSITLAALPSITATHELVVPRSMPITSAPEAVRGRRPRGAYARASPNAAAAAGAAKDGFGGERRRQ